MKNVKMSEQLKDYFETTPKEQQEKDFFNIACKMHGIDPTAPNAKRKLKWISFKNRYWYPIRRRMPLIFYGVISSLNMICAGMNLYQEYYWLTVLNVLGGVIFLVFFYEESKKYW